MLVLSPLRHPNRYQQQNQFSSIHHSFTVRNLSYVETDRRSSAVILEADSTLTAKTVGPEATELNVGLGHVGVGEEKPQTEDGLGEDVKDGVGNNLGVNRELARAIGDAPDTVNVSIGPCE